jgi:hypothetical protein
MNNFDISDSRLYDYLAEKNEQESTEKEYETFFDEDWQMERERDYDRD